jgi:hypothetical protein
MCQTLIRGQIEVTVAWYNCSRRANQASTLRQFSGRAYVLVFSFRSLLMISEVISLVIAWPGSSFGLRDIVTIDLESTFTKEYMMIFFSQVVAY